jgi:DNA-binding transcriptional MerR regulator
MYTVGELAKLAGVTVRTLHHYDEIGLVRPSKRSASSYRLYDESDLARLQQVMLFRELGVPLDEIAAAIASRDPRELLRQHRDALVEKRSRLDRMIAAVDAAIGGNMDPKSMFDGFDPSQYEDEVKQRWGNTEAYRESARRTQGYTKDDWARHRAESEAIYAALAKHHAAKTPVEHDDVQRLVEEHRLLIDRWFYPCGREMHRALGEMYVADPRFTANLDKHGEGFAQYLRDAIHWLRD